MIGWHWCKNDRMLGYGDGRKVVDGETLEETRPIKLCERGMHASGKILDAIRYAPGNVICRVKLHGEVIKGDDKLVASKRTVLWSVDASKALLLWAADCAERALSRVENPDPRSVAAIRLTREFVAGTRTKEELREGAATAYAVATAYAAYATAYAAYAAAYTAATAASNAATAAATAASNAAAYASNAATAAAYAASNAAEERKWQSKRLRMYIGKARRGEL